MNVAPFDPLEAIRVLLRYKVRFVLIGGFASRLYGSPLITNDLDLCYARDDDNLARLAEALVELKATLRGAPDEVMFILDAESLHAGDHFTFLTTAGALDCLGTPAGTSGYETMERTSQEMDLDGIRVRVASIDDLIKMKRAAGRAKDLYQIEVLAALREELDEAQAQRSQRKKKK